VWCVIGSVGRSSARVRRVGRCVRSFVRSFVSARARRGFVVRRILPLSVEKRRRQRFRGCSLLLITKPYTLFKHTNTQTDFVCVINSKRARTRERANAFDVDVDHRSPIARVALIRSVDLPSRADDDTDRTNGFGRAVPERNARARWMDGWTNSAPLGDFQNQSKSDTTSHEPRTTPPPSSSVRIQSFFARFF